MNLTPRLSAARNGAAPKSTFATSLAALSLMVGMGANASLAQTAGSYQITPILSDGYAKAAVVDAGFIDPWGFNNTGTFWINSNVSGLSYVNGVSGTVKLKAIVPPAAGTGAGKPTGIVKNTTTGFVLTNNAVPSFIFGTLDGTISGWSGALGSTLPSLVMVNNSSANAVYTDIALDASANGTVLLAANFGKAAKVEIYSQSYAPITLAGTFTDPNVPAGYAPYAIHTIGGQVFVTYMLRSTSGGTGYGGASYTETLGPNTGFVSVFDVNGNFVKRAITGGNLNAPWGMALAPTTFGVYGGDLLVGNLGDGLINVYDPNSFAYLGQLADATGKPVLNSLPGAGVAATYAGLWEIGFGTGTTTTAIANQGDPAMLYFAVGLDAEQHGLFGSIANVAATGGATTFGFSVSTPVLAVPRGMAGSATLAVSPVNGFAGTVSLSCSGLPANSTCTFTPATLSVGSAAPATTNVVISTDVATTGALRAEPGAGAIAFAMLPTGLLLAGLARRRRAAAGLRVVVAVLGLLSAGVLSGCGSTAASLVTPAGTSTVTVTATSGSVSQTAAIAVTIQ